MPVEAEPAVSLPGRKKRNFISEDFEPSSWDRIEPYYRNLEERIIGSVPELSRWLRDWSELGTAVEEYARWIYVRTTIDTSDEQAKRDLEKLYTAIIPRISPYDNNLKKKFISCPFTAQLDQEMFFTTIRKIKKEIELFRQENI